MLRVGLTGGLGSGKSTVASMFADLGAEILSADELGRQMMEPGESLYAAIVEHFGSEVLLPSGGLDRAALARIAFVDGRVAELNAIVHPAVISRQAELAAEIATRNQKAVLFVESALLFETEHAGEAGWRTRFDHILLVTSSEEDKIRRFLNRATTTSAADLQTREADARRRLAHQMDDAVKSRWADFVIQNNGSLQELRQQVEGIWPQLLREARARPQDRATY